MEKLNVHDKINLRGAIEKWRQNSVKAMGKSINRRGMERTGFLQRNLRSRSSYMGGAIQTVIFTVPLYAMFLDMAVAHGHKFGSRAAFMENRKLERALGQRFTRQPRIYKNLHWLNKVMYGRTLDLAKLQVNIWGDEFLSMKIPTKIEYSV